MARQTALRIRMNLALQVDTTDMAAFGDAVGKVEALRKAAEKLGFVQTADLSSTVGSFDFGEDEPKPEVADDNG